MIARNLSNATAQPSTMSERYIYDDSGYIGAFTCWASRFRVQETKRPCSFSEWGKWKEFETKGEAEQWCRDNGFTPVFIASF